MDFLLHLDTDGLKRAAAIALGVASAGTGFLVARFQSARNANEAEAVRRAGV